MISGDGVLAGELRAAAARPGYEVRGPARAQRRRAALADHRMRPRSRRLRPRRGSAEAAERGAARLVLCAAGLAGALDPAGSAVGFHVLPRFDEARLVELTRCESSSPLAAERAERLLAALGKHVAWVGDAPGPRARADRLPGHQRVRRSRSAKASASAADIDTGMMLGLSHPRGPLEWADAIGTRPRARRARGACREYREERYRPAPALRRLAAAGRTGPRGGRRLLRVPAADGLTYPGRRRPCGNQS